MHAHMCTHTDAHARVHTRMHTHTYAREYTHTNLISYCPVLIHDVLIYNHYRYKIRSNLAHKQGYGVIQVDGSSHDNLIPDTQKLTRDGRPHIYMNGVAIEQVEETKLLGITLDCKLSWSKHIDSMVVKLGRGLAIIKRCSAFLTLLSTKQVLQALVLSNLDYCPVVWSSAARKDLVKLQLAQNRALSRPGHREASILYFD